MLYALIAFICALILFFLIVNLVDLFRFQVNTYRLQDIKIKRDVKAVVLSDLHNKSYGKNNVKLLKAIDEQKPDFILCTGDMLTATPGCDFKVASDFMVALAQKYRVYYGIGNHEYRAAIYPEKYGMMYINYMEILRRAGIQILSNEKVFLTDCNIAVYGLTIDRKYYQRFKTYQMEAEYIQKNIGKVDESFYSVLLAHNPEYFDNYINWGADLTLSGHIHGGIVRFPFLGGVASPAVRFFPKYDAGKFTKNQKNMIISRGLGTHTIPVRIFNPGEVIVLDFKGKSS